MKLIGLTGDMSVAAALYLVEVLLHIVDILLHFVSILLQLLDQCGEFCAGSTERRHTETSLMTSHTGFSGSLWSNSVTLDGTYIIIAEAENSGFVTSSTPSIMSRRTAARRFQKYKTPRTDQSVFSTASPITKVLLQG